MKAIATLTVIAVAGALLGCSHSTQTASDDSMPGMSAMGGHGEHAMVMPAVYMGDADRPGAPLFDNLGDHHHPITTGVAQTQAYFDQGVRLMFAFNHAEAIRSFREAARLDPHCAMCWWGIAYALGPNINLPMMSDAARSGVDCDRARESRSNSTQARTNAPTSRR